MIYSSARREANEHDRRQRARTGCEKKEEAGLQLAESDEIPGPIARARGAKRRGREVRRRSAEFAGQLECRAGTVSLVGLCEVVRVEGASCRAAIMLIGRWSAGCSVEQMEMG